MKLMITAEFKNDVVLSHRDIFQQVRVYALSKYPIAPIIPIFIKSGVVRQIHAFW
jgi:hypothetical protein